MKEIYWTIIQVVQIFFLILIFYSHVFSQISSPPTPQFPSFQPIKINPHLNYNPNPLYQPQQRNHPLQPPNAQQIINQHHQLHRPPTQQEIIANLQMQAQQQRVQKHQQVLDVLNEVRADEYKPRKPINYSASPEFADVTRSYTAALQSIAGMADGTYPISQKDAYYIIESAYGNTYLSYDEYNKILSESADFIREWMQQNNLNPADNEAVNFAIQNFMSDTLVIKHLNTETKFVSTKKHLPFHYDYQDFQAEKDHRNYFITKCLATGFGQCNSMPGVYLVLAEALGANAYLSFAPQHSFIKYPDNKGNIFNYEPTSHWEISDQWYSDNFFISAEAVKHKIFLDTLSKKETVVNCLVDLAFGYMQKFGAADGKFVNECLSIAQKHFPGNSNIYVRFVKSSLLARQLNRLLNEFQISSLDEIHNSPEAKKLYDELMQNEQIISAVGFRQMPEARYLQLMQHHEFRGKEQCVNGKERRDLFVME